MDVRVEPIEGMGWEGRGGGTSIWAELLFREISNRDMVKLLGL